MELYRVSAHRSTVRAAALLFYFTVITLILGTWQNIHMMISRNPAIYYQYTFLKIGLMLTRNGWQQHKNRYRGTKFSYALTQLSHSPKPRCSNAFCLFFFFFFFKSYRFCDVSRQAESLYLDIIIILIVSYHELHEYHSQSYSFCHCVLQQEALKAYCTLPVQNSKQTKLATSWTTLLSLSS